MQRKTGIYEKIGNIDFFIPDSLPPQNPSFGFSSELIDLYGSAIEHLSKLNEMSTHLPDIERFIKAYVIKEALLSSAIEGIQTTLLDVFTQPLEGGTKISKETQLVLNYTQTLMNALSMIKEQGLPISSRIICAMHTTLMESFGNANPGNFRTQSVKVGNLVPPPAPQIATLIADLEHYIHSNDQLPPLVRAGLVHVQFETIHPFLDGNGRIGRLLIILMLVDFGLLASPILYISYYFKKYHHEYYRQLDRVRTHGDFEGWIIYFLTAVKESAIDAYKRAKDIEALEKNILQTMVDQKIVKSEYIAATIATYLYKFPVFSIQELANSMQKSYNATKKIIDHLVNVGILLQVEERRRNKLYRFDAYLKLLEKEY